MEPPAAASPTGARLRWGLGDFAWIYIVAIILGAVLGAIGISIAGDTDGHTGALATALSAVGQFGGWIGFIVWISYTKGRRDPRLDFGFRFDIRRWWGVFAGLGLFFVATLAILPIVDMINEHQQVVKDLEQASGAKLAVFVVLAALVAPIGEELLFRGLLLRALRRRMSPTCAIGVQALAFALAHPMLSPTLGDFAVVPALFLLGCASGVAAETTGDLSASILMHIGFNLVTTLAAI